MEAPHSNHPEQEQAIARLLTCRYGDGGVYVPRDTHRTVALKDAIAAGFISEDGFVTRKGRRLLARTDF